MTSPSAPRPLVLLANDDGVRASGLVSVREALLVHADVVVCAPDANQSATSHSLSLHRALRLRRISDGIFSLDGTPADCVYVAMCSDERVLPRTPDLVVSGMNHGMNLGLDVFYSGTVAAAREGALRGIPSIALSADLEADHIAAAAVGVRIALALLAAWQSDPRGPVPLLNVNIPKGSGWPVRATCLGERLYDDDVVYRKDPRGQEYLWIGGAGVRHEDAPGSDTEAYDEGYVSVTPLSLELFDATRLPFAARVVAGT
jgi:5'-nucleotidase